MGDGSVGGSNGVRGCPCRGGVGVASKSTARATGRRAVAWVAAVWGRRRQHINGVGNGGAGGSEGEGWRGVGGNQVVGEGDGGKQGGGDGGGEGGGAGVASRLVWQRRGWRPGDSRAIATHAPPPSPTPRPP